jgi:hypothetical protein
MALTGSSPVLHSRVGTLPAMSRHHPTALACVLAIPALLAGCGNSPGAAPASGNGPGEDEKSPLTEYMGRDITGSGGKVVVAQGGGGSSEEQLDQQRKVEELTATCMRAEGFQYVPVPPEANPKSKFEEVFKLPPDKFAEQYGYGISTLDLAAPEEDDDNPNKRIRNALSAKAKAAYDKALNGEMREVEAGRGGVIKQPDPKNLGCRGKAAEQVFGKGRPSKPGNDLRKFDGLFKDIEALRKRIESDPRVTEAARAWSDCMADANHTGLKKPDEAKNKVQQRMESLMGGQTGPGAVNRKIEPKNLDPVKLAELKKFELDIAKDDYDCQQAHYKKPFRDVQFQLEREFVETHKAILEQYRDWQAEMKGDR